MHKYSMLEKLLFLSSSLNTEKLRRAIEGKTVLITGASSGIGEQVAYMLADFQVHLILVARKVDKLLAVKDQIEKKEASVSIFCADLRSDEEMKGLLSFIHRLPNGLDIVVSNAGLSINRPISQSLDRFHDFTRTMAINYFAPVQLMLSLIPILEKNKGQVINISTINALLLPFPNWAGYQASKSAFDTWFRSAAPELNAMEIATASIYLPLVKTPMILPTIAYEKMPAMCPNHVAKIICKTMYTKRKTYKPWWLIFGEVASILFRGIYERLIPKIFQSRGK
ncbi:SDR family NAD(P)-dependent oxidoreductase [Bacillus sp. S/N-304-OC-R1]|uniref:SDR family NAD(P)-dependent oxidoreductase n=1 Tax=Bacillus sp. S/N-304-OC-R1 TaxID=2758034 RepID=UPI001C8D7B40|nr:SDR family NAD(P)-dependent oxidoreductase [Bacillus sp. S/N-304-OC-R1]MBY0121820.1 SDR family NAD(P)-dependent oxidoreductase [Bacillus sp. S/N-304-OC-R1]